ncbi:ABC transporter substrate-binding protein [Sphingomonas naphthae]|uniref:ABC transporter substrate-binding protein n=1 Tax=Sphingomonas naphthae TaxID=1813468 RepID=A0ABY7TQC6_9SPHN|nr:ABC transporter substrate-binding protein [Sphingomonas naphthae]WCT75150.1 ABC transporter substrate-binding protein [Sphingomonas naphthae]
MPRPPLPIALAALALLGAAPAPPKRIVSVNLCADQYLLALADPAQIAGLTSNAADPDMSAAAAQARGHHIMRKSAEERLALDPDLILGKTWGLTATADPRVPVLPLPPAESYAAIVEQVRTVAAAVGHPARGAALVARMDRELAALPRPGRGRVAAYYQRRGFMTGTGTLVDDLMARVGLVNLAARLGKPPLSQLSLEEMIAARPDFLIVESATDRVTDQGTEMLHHPILAAIPRLRIPEAWTVCGGPAYVLAARSLAAQLARRR